MLRNLLLSHLAFRLLQFINKSMPVPLVVSGLKGGIGLLCCVGAKSEFGELTTFLEPLEYRLSKLFVVGILKEWNKF